MGVQPSQNVGITAFAMKKSFAIMAKAIGFNATEGLPKESSVG